MLNNTEGEEPVAQVKRDTLCKLSPSLLRYASFMCCDVQALPSAVLTCGAMMVLENLKEYAALDVAVSSDD